jgi:hypothetical protein
MNIAEGVALCSECGRLSALSELVYRKRPAAELLARPPFGCKIVPQDHAVVVRVRCWSASHFLTALWIALFWNGILSVFILFATAGLWQNLVGPLPQWFPAPHMQQPMPLGMAIFLWIFLLPFIGIGCLLIRAVIMLLAGRVEVLVGEYDAEVRSGVGPIVWRRRFDPTVVAAVRLRPCTDREGIASHGEKEIVIEADRTVRLGRSLPEERLEWLHAVLQRLLPVTDWASQRWQVMEAGGQPDTG